MSTEYKGIITPYNTADFEAMVRDVRKHFNADGAACQQVGIDLRRLLPKAKNISGRRGMMGADIRIAAWQIARQFAQADAALRGASAAVGKAFEIYYGSVHEPRTKKTAGHGRRFDAA